MTASNFASLDHVPYVQVAVVEGEDGSVLLSLGDDVAVARLALVTAAQTLIVALSASAQRDLGVALIEAAGRIEQRALK